mmetsp:Transcript_64994/g.209350  ORF Transcript_64994/g.209350 Transcript_64994/m.209350 type:complete len:191 (+) Transcript_64994:108-680(+)
MSRAMRLQGRPCARGTVPFCAAALLVLGGATAFLAPVRQGASPAATAHSTVRAMPTMTASLQGTSCLSGPAVLTSAGAVVCLPAAGATGRRSRAVATRGGRAALRAKEYWAGEWICADCGYIYNERAFGSKFEDLQMGFKCPNCAAPRRRFARKLGDKIGTTLDGGDTPILVFSAVALVVVLAIAYFALQ